MGYEAALNLPAMEGVKILEEVLKEAEVEAFKHRQNCYSASLPLYVNSEELPEPPEPPEWLQDLIDDD